jgi:hypothetical protein
MVLYLEDLGVNVFSIVIGAMGFVIVVTWIDAIDAITDYIYIENDDEVLRYQHFYYKKLIAALYITGIGLLIVIILYTYYKSNYTKHLKPNGK